MKRKYKLFCMSILLAIFCVGVRAQVAPPGAGDKNLEDRNVKGRSVELERISREAHRPATPVSKEAQELQFREIKEDFEQIQFAQSEIVDAYMKGTSVDYARIALNADKMTSGSKRLMGNLFPQPEAKKSSKKADKLEVKTESTTSTEIKTLIVDLDNSLAAFTGNRLFTNPQVVNSDDNLKAQADLQKIITLSSTLKREADKLKKP